MTPAPHGVACVVTHGGAGQLEENRDACEAACSRARAVLEGGGSALEAAVAAVVVLEDDPRLNAGTGSVLRADGHTVQCDAAVMDAHGFGAVAAVEGVKNPVHLARAVYDLPHLLVVGDGAMALADRLGLPRADLLTDDAKRRYQERLAARGELTLWKSEGIDEVFRYALGEGTACDTVGAAVRDGQGRYAAAGSTGGIWCALRGRVGDTPIPGAGLLVGDGGAVCATGVGEYIWRHLLSTRVHDQLLAGRDASAATTYVLGLDPGRPPEIDVGLIAVGPGGAGAACTRRMPWAMWEGPVRGSPPSRLSGPPST